MKTQEKLNKLGQRHIQDCRQMVKNIWETMCREDDMPEGSKFVIFSEETLAKYGRFYNQALNRLTEAQVQYRNGGYVGLRIVNGRAVVS